MAAPAKIDWNLVRNEYIADSSISYSDLAKKYGVTKTAVQKRGTSEGWSELRQNYADKAFTLFTEKLLDQKSSAQNRHLQHWQNLQALANNAIIDISERSYERNKAGEIITDKKGNPIPTRVNLGELANLAKTLKTAIDGERVVLGLPNTVTALSDPSGDSVWSGFSDMIKEADRVLAEYGDKQGSSDRKG